MKKTFVFTLLFLAFTSARSQSFTVGYQSLVVFTDGHSVKPVGETEAMCQSNEDRIVESYIDMFTDRSVAVDLSKSLPCGPRSSGFLEVDVAAWSKLDFPPVCLSCPLLQPATFEIYYPGYKTEIKDLYYQYGIDHYNYELKQLQLKYSLQQFEKEVFILNNEINKLKQSL